jgi:UDP-N-acetylglucosamine 1-carboxyvinyltransferase
MDKLLIRGGRRLNGTVTISGAKNAALPDLCAALLSAEPMVLNNVPRLQDVSTMLKLLRNMGCGAEWVEGQSNSVRLDGGGVTRPEAPYELVKTMRASILALGPLLARFGQAKCRCPAAARSARGRSTSTSRACRRWAPRSRWSTATSRQGR